MPPVIRRPRVIVIGAGISGLACARELEVRGYEVLIVEARKRVGGRLKAGELVLSDGSEQNVDLGGKIIHGIVGNPMYAITQEMGIRVRKLEDTLLLNESGWPVDPKEDDKVSSVFNDCLEEAFKRASGKQSETSFGDLYKNVCNERNISTSALLRWHQANLEVSCGASFDDLGWQWNEDEAYGFDGEHVALQPSWKAVTEGLAQGLNVLYDSPIKLVEVIHPNEETEKKQRLESDDESKEKEHRKRRATVSPPPSSGSTPTRRSRRLRGEDASLRRSDRANKGLVEDRFTVDHASPQVQKRKRPTIISGPKNSKVRILLAKGVVLEAEAAVCTLPLGILKLDESHPQHVGFDPPLSDEKREAIEKLGTGLLNKCALSFSHTFWQDSDFMGIAEEEHSYLVLNAAVYTGKPILIFMYGGAFAREIEDWTDSEIVEDCLAVMKKICGRNVPDPIDYHITRWGHEQYSRMAFTYIPPGADGFNHLHAMSKPVLNHTNEWPVLMFAGEHTTPYHPSTIHGAFLSGIREAYRLDLALEPQANGNLVFSETEIYQRTFTIKRKSDSSKIDTTVKVAPKSLQAVSDHPRRRRGTSGVMKLRRRPKTIVQYRENSPKSRSDPASEDLLQPIRRSPRSIFSHRKMNTAAGGAQGADQSDDKEGNKLADYERHSNHSLDELEERVLRRGVESYGKDFEYFSTTLLPVYGRTKELSSSGNSESRLRKRYQKLASGKRSGTIVRSSAGWKSWISKPS